MAALRSSSRSVDYGCCSVSKSRSLLLGIRQHRRQRWHPCFRLRLGREPGRVRLRAVWCRRRGHGARGQAVQGLLPPARQRFSRVLASVAPLDTRLRRDVLLRGHVRQGALGRCVLGLCQTRGRGEEGALSSCPTPARIVPKTHRAFCGKGGDADNAPCMIGDADACASKHDPTQASNAPRRTRVA